MVWYQLCITVIKTPCHSPSIKNRSKQDLSENSPTVIWGAGRFESLPVRHSSLPCRKLRTAGHKIRAFATIRSARALKEAKNALRSLGGEGFSPSPGKAVINPGCQQGIVMHYAYILKSENDSSVLYHGFTSDIRQRLAAHNCGANLSTRAMRPWAVAWYGAFVTEEAARAFEHYMKTASGKAFARKRLLSNC